MFQCGIKTTLLLNRSAAKQW